MGTRSLTHIMDDREEAVLATIYSQMDGYPTGMGANLKEILAGRAMVNGFGSGTPEKASNGAGCLAATIIKELKDGIGGVYLEPPGSTDHGEEYVYTVAPAPVDGKDWENKPTAGIRLKVEAVRGGYGDSPRELKLLYEGDVNDFDPEATEKAFEEAD